MKSAEPSAGLRDLVDELLAEQRQLAAVERFSLLRKSPGAPARERFYRDLIPLRQPRPGEQYAFEVDLDKCSGCKACVSACHSLNGLDENETWRGTGLLIGRRESRPFQQTITTACHHCVDPGCLNGCPVLAYDKDPVSGIVRHLDDQCIGCQYCVMMCPYEVPQYSKVRGIVRKCDMCHGRLIAGEAPACVQACPGEAIRITVVEPFSDSPNTWLPDSPDPQITQPTTRYISRKPLPATLLAADHAHVAPAPPHLPLVFMLVLTQMAAGVSVASVFIQRSRWLPIIAASAGAAGLAIASLHLGKPLKAWRAFLGWRKSWFSREVIAFSLFAGTAIAAASVPPANGFSTPLKIFAAIVGLAGVACSAMIYVDTKRAFWNPAQCFGRFFGTVFALGAMVSLSMLTASGAGTKITIAILLVSRAVVSIAKFAIERIVLRHSVDENTVELTSLNRTARLLTGKLGAAWRSRVALGILGNVALPAVVLIHLAQNAPALPYVVFVALGLCVSAELLSCYLFFAAVAPARMPGGAGA